MTERDEPLPRVARAVLRAALSTDAFERAMSDLADLHERVAASRGSRAARRACLKEVPFILAWAAVDKTRGALEESPPMNLPQIGQDVRYAARSLLRSPGFAAVVLLTLGLGIGATTAIFSVVDGVLLHPVPYPEAERIVVVGWDWSGQGDDATWSLTSAKAQFWKDRARSFDAFAIADNAQYVMIGEGDPAQIAGQRVSTGYFEVIGLAPQIGRAFAPEEDRPGGAPVVILTDGFWRRAFGADPAIVGRSISLDRTLHTVVGVMPPAFRGAEQGPVDVLTPLQLEVNPRAQGHNYFAFGRLAPGATTEQLAAELATSRERLGVEYPEQPGERGMFLTRDLPELLVGDFLRTAVLLLFGAVATVLLIACANVTSLLLGRAETRRRDIAVRAALGAGRGRIVAQVVSEGLVLTLVGGALGLLFARLALDGILGLAPEGVPGLDRVGLSLPVLGFALGVALLTGVGVGLAGALPVLRAELGAIKEGGRGHTTSAPRVRARGLLLMSEAAFSVVLLVGAGLVLASFVRLRGVDLGFEPEGVRTIELRLPPDRYSTTAATWDFERRVLERIAALPGVVSVGSAANLPLERGLNTGVSVFAHGAMQKEVIELRSVSPDFLATIGASVSSGRMLTAEDGPGAPPVALVNETFARLYFPEGDALGRTLAVDELGQRAIVGVVRDLRDMDLRQDARPTVFISRPQLSNSATRAMNEYFVAAFVVRTADGASGLEPALRAAVLEADPEQPILRIGSLGDVIAASIARDRFNVRLFAGFGSVALLLTAIGVYGVVSHSVGQRRHEIGLRMALGAQRGGVVALAVRQGMKMVVVGIALGLLGAAAASRFLQSILFGVEASDPRVFAAVAGLIAAVALLASWVPARRASRVDPVVALRE